MADNALWVCEWIEPIRYVNVSLEQKYVYISNYSFGMGETVGGVVIPLSSLLDSNKLGLLTQATGMEQS